MSSRTYSVDEISNFIHAIILAADGTYDDSQRRFAAALLCAIGQHGSAECLPQPPTQPWQVSRDEVALLEVVANPTAEQTI